MNDPVARWEGFDVRLSGPTVYFGEAANDWIRPLPEYEWGTHDLRPTMPLRSASVSPDGRLLSVFSDEFEFTFFSVAREPYGPVFHYRPRRLGPTLEERVEALEKRLTA